MIRRIEKIISHLKSSLTKGLLNLQNEISKPFSYFEYTIKNGL